MKQVKSFLINRLSYFFLIFFLTVFSCFFQQAGSEELTLSVGDWPPYIDSRAADNGFLSEIVIKSFKRTGTEVKLSYRPWKRAEVEVDQNNKVSFGWVRNEERSEKWLFSEEIYKGTAVFAVRKDRNISWKIFEDLKPFRIGITRGYSYGDEFDRFKEQLKIDEVASDEMNLKKLLAKRIDLFPVDYVNGTELLRTRFTPDERKEIRLVTERPVNFYGIFLVCAKTNDKCPYYIKKFNEGLNLIIQDGTRQRIIEQSLSLE